MKRKYQTALNIIQKQKCTVKIKRSSRKRNKSPSVTKMDSKKVNTKEEFIILNGSENKDKLKNKIFEANEEIQRLKEMLIAEQNKSFDWEVNYLKTFGQLADLESHNFNYKNLKTNNKNFQYLCGLTVVQYLML